MAIVVTCTCGKQLKVKEELAGKRGKCPACGSVVSIPTLAPTVNQETTSPSPPRECPTCHEALQPNSVICLNCGLDLRTGKQVPKGQFSPATPSSPTENEPASSARLWIGLIAGVTCLVGLTVAGFLLFRDRGPAGSALAPPNRKAHTSHPAASAAASPTAHLPPLQVGVPVAKTEGVNSKVSTDLPLTTSPTTSVPTKSSPVAVPTNTTRSPAGVALVSSKFVDAISIRLRINPLGPEEDLQIGAQAGRRLLWTEFKLTQPGLMTIDLTKLQAHDAAGGEYRVAGFKVGRTHEESVRPQISQLLRNDGLKGPVLPSFSGGSSSTEFATLRIDASPDAITVHLKSGEAVVSFVFVVAANVTDLTIRNFAGGDMALGTPGVR